MALIETACMALIEQACTDASLSGEVRGSCSIFVAMMGTYKRSQSAAKSKTPTSSEFENASLGVIESDKHPNPDKMATKVFVLDHTFIFGDDWHAVHSEAHKGCPCMSRATAFPGKPVRGGGWSPGQP